MSKIFSKNQGPAVDIKRNTFDLSYATHITGKLGQLIPVMCQEVLPGDSFQIDPKFGIRFNPTVFPIQSKVHGVMHFFYVRNRNLWKDWPEYIGRTNDDAVMPYLDVTPERAKKMLGTGTLADYFGVPTTVTGSYAQYMNVELDYSLPAVSDDGVRAGRGTTSTVSGRPGFSSSALGIVNSQSPSWLVNNYANATDYSTLAALFETDWNEGNHQKVGDLTYTTWTGAHSPVDLYGYWSKTTLDAPIDGTKAIRLNGGNLSSPSKLDNGAYIVIAASHDLDGLLNDSCVYSLVPVVLAQDGNGGLEISSSDVYRLAEKVNPLLGTSNVYLGLFFSYASVATTGAYQTDPSVLPTATTYKRACDSLVVPAEALAVRDATSETAVAFNPFVRHAGETTPKIKLNSLSWRAYESIYNYFYRDETVAPYQINGKDVYNDFIPTHNGGADSNDYVIHRRNWERDYYTSCQPSPQQGTAPLVGISANGTFTFDDGENQYTASMTVGDDGETITGISTYSPDMPKGSLRQLMDVVTNGLSINDLRQTSALQRWLETNIRRGYKYVDQIYSHFGINPAFKANDMPEFLGGIHVVADVNQVNNTTTSDLGQYAGQMSMFGSSDNKISKFFDEHGFCFAVLQVFPEPIYSQMLPKHFLKTETPLDYFFPEFGHIGMQPITYNEVTPIEVAASDAANSTDTLNDVFGYQRAWADYLANVDTVHGDFRTTMSDFVISRVFHDKPELGQEFIQIDDNDINDVFVTTDDSDKMLGEIRFDIKAQRPIPQYGIPRLE